MKIGIDLRRLAPDDAGPLTPWLRGALLALLSRESPHLYVLFHTPFNYHLFPALPAHVERRTLSTRGFAEELQNQAEYEGDFALLLRGYPDGVLTRFPLARQVVCVAGWSHEQHPERLPAAALRQLRRDLRAHQTRGGAVAVPDAAVERAVRADAWTTVGDVFAVPPGAPDDPASWSPAADALLAAFERVEGRAARPARLSVRTPPVVSVVTPSFNQGRFIRQTIDSVLGQDYPHIDYRVIDGGSTDDTVAILKGYGDRLKWVSEEDRGQAHAINKGVAQARGEVLSYLNSDDLLRPGAVARVAEHFLDRPACDLVYGRDAMVDTDGNYLAMYPTGDYSFERLVDSCCISQPAAFWRRRLADAVGPFDESLHLVMDFDYWLRADRAGGVIEHVPEILAQTRIHRQTKSRGGGEAAAHHRRFYDELFAVSYRHAGYVSSDYIHKWLFTAVFNARPWTRRFEGQISRVVQRWHHNRFRCGMGRVRAFRDLYDSERPILRPLLRRAVRALDPRSWLRPPTPPVGLEPDLWLGPELTVAHAGGPLRLAGAPARDAVLRVFRGRVEVASVPLRAGEEADVCVDVPGPGPVRISFSESELLPDGRRAAFELRGTTFLSEGDAK